MGRILNGLNLTLFRRPDSRTCSEWPTPQKVEQDYWNLRQSWATDRCIWTNFAYIEPIQTAFITLVSGSRLIMSHGVKVTRDFICQSDVAMCSSMHQIQTDSNCTPLSSPFAVPSCSFFGQLYGNSSTARLWKLWSVLYNSLRQPGCNCDVTLRCSTRAFSYPAAIAWLMDTIVR